MGVRAVTKRSTKTPSREHPVEGQVRDALDDLAQRPTRDAGTGRFITGNVAGGTTLARSEHFWDAVGAAKRELADQVLADLGADDGAAAETLVGIADAYAEARLLRHAMFLRLVELGGPVTTKGKARALFSSYLQALDRETRLAQALGLERKARAVTLADAINNR